MKDGGPLVGNDAAEVEKFKEYLAEVKRIKDDRPDLTHAQQQAEAYSRVYGEEAMEKEPEVGQRRHLLIVKIEGDTVEEVKRSLDQLAMYIERERNGKEVGMDLCSGGCDSSTIAVWTEDPEMDAEKYKARLGLWSKWRAQQRERNRA